MGQLERLVRSGRPASRIDERTMCTDGQAVYVDMCGAWVPQPVAERMLPLILQAVEAGTAPKAAAEEIDARLREELGADWTGGRKMIQRGVRSLRASKRALGAARRLGPTLIQLIPAFLRPWFARVHRPFARYLAAAKYRRRYENRFVSEIHEEDDLLHYSLDVASVEPAFRYYRAVRMYFDGGAWNAAEVEKVLDDVGCSVRETSSLLEFACGYGRLTRHFVHTISPSKITVSDIDRRAVDFVKDEFGVDGFYSAGTPEQLAHDRRYDLIVVVSLFSHVAIQDWGPWLRRLNKMLNADGVMLFSVLGMHAWNVNVSDVDRHSFQAKAEGFLYSEGNETRGRLSGENYGVAYVSEKYVEQAVSANFAGRLLKSCPRALNGFQDAYVLQRGNGDTLS